MDIIRDSLRATRRSGPTASAATAEGVYVDKKGTGWFRTRVFKDGISNPSLSKSVKVRVHT